MGWSFSHETSRNKNLSWNCRRNKLYFYQLTLMIIHLIHMQNHFSTFLSGIKSISLENPAVNQEYSKSYSNIFTCMIQIQWYHSSCILLLLLSNVFTIVLVAIVILYLLSIGISANLSLLTLLIAARERNVHSR